MSVPLANSTAQPHRTGRSVAAILAGFVAVAILSLSTDQVFHMLGVYPPWGQRMTDSLFLLATAYRIPYTILGGYLTARLAPYRPMKHAMVLAGIGLLASIAGAVATWNKDLGPNWYPLALVVMAVPLTWLGAKLYERTR